MAEWSAAYPGGMVWADEDCFLRIRPEGGVCIRFASPRFRLEGFSEPPRFRFSGEKERRALRNGGTGYILIYRAEGLRLLVELRVFAHSPAVRFRMSLLADPPIRLVKPDGRDDLVYTGFTTGVGAVTELQFSQYVPQHHSYVPMEIPVDTNFIACGADLTGPVLFLEKAGFSALVGYEHGATCPDAYLRFRVEEAGKELAVSLQAGKGNYFHGQVVDEDHPFESAWFHFLAVPGGKDALLRAYRTFFHRDISENGESRKPYIFYNTWNYQERDHNFRGTPYLENMREDRVLAEIERAHEMGVEVFVVDTGWYRKTGDWLVNTDRFPDGLQTVRRRLESYGMKLGLWFNPTVAAETSEVVLTHPEYRMSMGGEFFKNPIWETEDSYGMCLCSDYWETFADLLIRLYDELGVRYFKWDGIDQYGCDSPLHDHGGADNSAGERADCYSYLMGLRMIRVVERLTERCPDVIVDFDVTESGRFMGLGFLSAGKYFLVNNGPYAKDFDLPEDYRYDLPEPIRLNPWTNLFFYPGAARPRICRQGVKYDSYLPSVLFLTHYLPDGDETARQNSLASFVLGGNGIWGDLSGLSPEELYFWREHLELYKQVRTAATAVPARVTGEIGSSPEIYEKVDATGAGLVCFFAHRAGQYRHIVGPFADDAPPDVRGADRLESLPGGRWGLCVDLPEDGARTVFLLREES